MAKQDTSELTDAAAAFDAELSTYTRLGELFLKTPLSSVKHLERANAVLADIAGCEERLQAARQALVQALSASRDRQEQLAKQVWPNVDPIGKAITIYRSSQARPGHRRDGSRRRPRCASGGTAGRPRLRPPRRP